MSKQREPLRTYYVVQCDYGYGDGWEDLGAYDKQADAQVDRDLYATEEQAGPYRIVRRYTRD